jgi:transposase-like protein
VEVSPTLISNVTDAVTEEVKTWQSRPLKAVYPIVYLDGLHFKIREAGPETVFPKAQVQLCVVHLDRIGGGGEIAVAVV